MTFKKLAIVYRTARFVPMIKKLFMSFTCLLDNIQGPFIYVISHSSLSFCETVILVINHLTEVKYLGQHYEIRKDPVLILKSIFFPLCYTTDLIPLPHSSTNNR